MAERTRPIRIEFCVTEQERSLIQSKMAQLGTRNMGAYQKNGNRRLHHQSGLHPAEKACSRSQPCRVKYQSDLPPDQHAPGISTLRMLRN